MSADVAIMVRQVVRRIRSSALAHFEQLRRRAETIADADCAVVADWRSPIATECIDHVQRSTAMRSEAGSQHHCQVDGPAELTIPSSWQRTASASIG